MRGDAYESLAMSVFVFALVWFGASHGAAPAKGAGTVEEPSIAEVRGPDGPRTLQISFSRDPADAHSAGSYWDWMQGWAMP